MDIVEKNIEKLSNLCNKYNVQKLHLFGSILNDKFKNDSDIDFLVNFNNADNYFDFKFSLEDLFHRKIDLLEGKALKIQYAEKFTDIPNSLFIRAHSLLFEPDIKTQNIEVFDWQETEA